jgi:hypothetical protein
MVEYNVGDKVCVWSSIEIHEVVAVKGVHPNYTYIQGDRTDYIEYEVKKVCSSKGVPVSNGIINTHMGYLLTRAEDVVKNARKNAEGRLRSVSSVESFLGMNDYISDLNIVDI